ncbi:MAG: tRNA (N6-isopentenyl adenosine(37)-C2)-methylthiotransferase MiaB [Ruminococcaceae bacterium]|nr:tRNA (N6-isopentenyl adenosine(37)-C2)-methylthiotransferase MiaB [Oscillospiraceae bacterium]
MERNQILIPDEKIREQYNYMERVRLLLGSGVRKAVVMTFGCQQNEADSERLAGMLHEMGYTIVKEPEDVDLILVNTCAVREHAELKTLSITGQYKHLKQKNPSLLIGICGCMVSQEHRKEDIKQKYPYVDFLFGTEGLYRLPEILYTKLKSGKRQFHLNEGIGNIAEGLPVYRESSFKAWVSIMYGCNNFCSYCIVPYVRGRERSRDPEEILKEVRELAESGVKEITLLGQNVNSYGKDLPEPMEFATLLEKVCEIPGEFTVRFMTSHPKDATKRLIDVMAANDKIAKAFHLPLQSGSDRILKVMNRRYTQESYLTLARYIKEKMPDISLTTDIIVGFPGETEEDFEGTLSVLKEVRFDNIYSFIYSKRVGTPAASMPDQVPSEVSQDRFARMLKLQDEISLSKNRENIGKILPVLVEGVSKTDPDRLTGRTEKGRLVHFKGPEDLIGKEASVRITDVLTHSFFGELI